MVDSSIIGDIPSLVKVIGSAGIVIAFCKIVVTFIKRNDNRELSIVYRTDGEIELSIKGHPVKDEKSMMKQISRKRALVGKRRR
jgi:hypothetical protein